MVKVYPDDHGEKEPREKSSTTLERGAPLLFVILLFSNILLWIFILWIFFKLEPLLELLP